MQDDKTPWSEKTVEGQREHTLRCRGKRARNQRSNDMLKSLGACLKKQCHYRVVGSIRIRVSFENITLALVQIRKTNWERKSD